jgi:hypothetical protein
MTQKYCTEGCTGRTGSVLIRFYGCESVSVSPERERSPRRRHRRRNRHRPRPAWVTNLHTGRPATASGRDGGDARRRGAERTRRADERHLTTARRAGRGKDGDTRTHVCRTTDASPGATSTNSSVQAAGPSPWRRACVRTAQHGHPPPLVVVTLEIVTDSPIPPHSRPRQHTPGGPRREYRIRRNRNRDPTRFRVRAIRFSARPVTPRYTVPNSHTTE